MSGPLTTKAPHVTRSVKVEIADLPIWSVDALFHRIHHELDKPNVSGKISATLVIHYDLTEAQYEALGEFGDKIWQPIEIELLDERIKERQAVTE